MINEQSVDDIIHKLDAELTGGPDALPVAMGMELFAALVRRGLVADHAPAPLDDAAVEADKTTYRDTHPAKVDPHLPDDGFAVGRRS